MTIEVLRIGQRIVRDDRVTTHVALVSRAFGAKKIYMNEINPEIKDTLTRVNKSWGNGFELEYIENWRTLLKSKKKEGAKIVHLTMYGQNINDVQKKISKEKQILIVVGAEKVPRDVYENADYNVAVGNQPHSEISALAIVLDRIQGGKQFDAKFDNARLQIIPSEKGKQVISNK
ncbi:MAG: tRNA (cytidine(56)-2'-O)-methyltransferase [Nitrososphaeria archaeon]|nr:tRNA (cytidine(56)-2'-O)-methyltransferase [Nitrososphaeria archaeon]NDB51816.1 tRNA (cytidine(56)-2'-O)-methyltransferase [Nitrosopumilaceae archaeon]NDB88987.1 tRNA (cytidine(56)-2'-O)-methyltransferase [Nitrososphaerota archaeon]NDB46336.1 tRNA (cytidine(56)-2'-O)-methyltransferase [Nitrososphaeria archaeon]NDB63594.1 tRNA (cytidine(56)-2'-O)-methyltransferase [Nitrosopumilaceae archaeon]